MKKMYGNKWAAFLFMLPAIILFTAVVFAPICYCGYLSLCKIKFAKAPEFVALDNYAKIFKAGTSYNELFMTALKNTIFFMVFSVITQLIVGMTYAVLLTNIRRGRNLFKNVIYLPCVLSSSALGLLFCFLLKPQLGLNQLLALVGITGPAWLSAYEGFIPLPMWVIGFVALWQYVGQNMMLYMAQIMGIGRDLYEASYVDGASKPQAFLHITMPLVKPMIVTAMSLNCIGSLKFFDLVYNMTQGGPTHVTENLATLIYYYGIQISDKSGIASAMSMILLAICLLTTLLVNKVIRVENYEM